MKTEPRQFKPKLTTIKIDYCLLHMLRDPELFELARQNLQPTDFSTASEMRYAVLWSAALAAAERNGGALPTEGTELCIAGELVSKIDNSHGEVTPEAGDRALNLLDWIFRFNATDLNPAYHRDLIQDLIERTIIRDLNKTTALVREVGRPLDLPEALEQAASRIRELKQTGTSIARNLREEWPDFQTRLQEYRGREFLGLRTGLSQLDNRTLGLRGLILLGAMPNVGKTLSSCIWGLTSSRTTWTPASCSSAWKWTGDRYSPASIATLRRWTGALWFVGTGACEAALVPSSRPNSRNDCG
jgi:hypothetical protein